MPDALVLVCVLARDRPEGLEACLAGLSRAGAPARVVVHLDQAEPEVRAIAEASRYEVLSTESQIGIGGSLNRVLALREPGQHFCRIDGDTEIETDGWLAMLLADLEDWATVSTALRLWDGTWGRDIVPEDATLPLRWGRGIGSVMLCRSDACDRLGGFREAIPYAFEDTDWYDRLRKARLRAGMNLRVVAREAAPPSRKLWPNGCRKDPEFVHHLAAFMDEVHPIRRPIQHEASV